MGVYYMKHFIHGTKVACSDSEVEYDKKQGWVQYDPLEQLSQVLQETEAPVNTLVKRPYNRKPKE